MFYQRIDYLTVQFTENSGQGLNSSQSSDKEVSLLARCSVDQFYFLFVFLRSIGLTYWMCFNLIQFSFPLVLGVPTLAARLSSGWLPSAWHDSHCLRKLPCHLLWQDALVLSYDFLVQISVIFTLKLHNSRSLSIDF